MSVIVGLRNIIWCTEVANAIECLEAAVPLLRAHAHSCEVCEGSGEILRADDTGEECRQCAPIWDLIKRIETPRQVPAPAAPVSESQDFDLDDLPF